MKKIIIDKSHDFLRTALIEGGKLVDIFIEKKAENIVGNIYRGKVLNVEKSLHSAFVDIGLLKNGFLPLNDLKVKQNDTITVQVMKNEVGEKGVFLSSKLQFQGDFSILIYGESGIFISKKITDTEKREQLKKIAAPLLPDDFSVILRTSAENKPELEIYQEINNLLSIGNKIVNECQYYKAPALVYEDSLQSYKSMINFLPDVDEVICNTEPLLMRFKEDALRIYPQNDITFTYSKSINLFSDYFLDTELQNILKKKVWLKSGGFIIIEETEACVVIDVNTGKAIESKNQQKTILKTNIEAACEIARQIRLRKLMGLIIIDFINMENKDSIKKVENTFVSYMSYDTKAIIGNIDEFGLLHLTRKKDGKSLKMTLTSGCRYCGGNGYMFTDSYIAMQIEKSIINKLENTIFKNFEVKIKQSVIEYIKNYNVLDETSNKYGATINFVNNHKNDFEITNINTNIFS